MPTDQPFFYTENNKEQRKIDIGYWRSSVDSRAEEETCEYWLIVNTLLVSLCAQRETGNASRRKGDGDGARVSTTGL